MVDLQTVLTGSVVVLVLTVVFLSIFVVRRLPYRYTREEVEKIVDARLKSQLYIVKGQIGEQFAPHMKEFMAKYEPADARFLGGKPCDYIVFDGYSKAYDTDQPIRGVVFVEVKTSKYASRSPDKNERKILDAIKNGKVGYDTITIQVGDTSS